jgi:nucleoside-diphosphate-sugar epimerase
MQVLVIGGTGFVGRAITPWLTQAGHQVTLMNRGSIPVDGTRQITVDRNDRRGVAAALRNERFDAVIDSNCYTADQADILISAAARIAPRISMISSASVYSDDAVMPPDENSPIGGATVWASYGSDKAKAEGVYRAAAGRFESCSIFRPPYIFGFGNSSDRETWFWSRQLNAAPILLPGDGKTQVQFVHVADLAKAVETIARGTRRGLDVFNIADPQILNFSELATLLARVASCDDKQISVGAAAQGLSARSWFPFRDYPCLTDSRRLMRETGWAPESGLAIRFAETFSAYASDFLKARLHPTEAEKTILRACSLNG